MPERQKLGQKFFTGKYLDIHQTDTPANGGGKRIQDIYGRGDPFCETVVTMGLAERGDLLSKDGEDGLGGITGLKTGKEWMRGKVFLDFTSVSFQRGIENGHKFRMRGGRGGDGGHDGSWISEDIDK
jgi:hypothetical protein